MQFQTIETWLENEQLQPKKAKLSELCIALDWVLQYETDDQEFAQKFANAAAFIQREIDRRNQKSVQK